MKHLATQDDLALIKLAEPVSGNIKSIKLNTEFNESGKIVTVFGRGAVGNGKTGENPETKQKKVLNHFQNEIEETHKQWLVYTFDASPNGLPLEGMHGSGDSGGPAVITQNGQQLLIGLSSWQHWEGDLANFKGGLYGTQAYLVKISYYIGWIQSVLKAE
jgi:secreted trypsin-like serine protease